VKLLRVVAISLAAVLCAYAGAGAQAPPPFISVVGQLLWSGDGYLVFTTGDALRLDPALAIPKNLRLGQTIRVTLDVATHAVTALTPVPKSLAPGDIDAAKLPREFAVASPGSKRSGPVAGAETGPAAHAVTVTINVRVPDNTPTGDDVYLATDRTNFAPAEIRMIRLDARTWSASLQVPSGSQVRYEFTRGNFANIERDKLGGIVTPRTLTAEDNLQTHDGVAHWADIT